MKSAACDQFTCNDWEKEESHKHKHKRFLTVLHRRKIMRNDGTSYYVHEPTLIDADQRHPHDEVLDHDDMTIVGSGSSDHEMHQQANTQSV
jgi:hypothetical protein